MNKNHLAKRLKELRNQRGMSQEVLADESGLSMRTIQRIENGETNPTGESLKRLSNALNVKINFFWKFPRTTFAYFKVLYADRGVGKFSGEFYKFGSILESDCYGHQHEGLENDRSIHHNPNFP